ncbi:MAG: acyl carrier protein [Vulcanimicrobiaceae bacterium]
MTDAQIAGAITDTLHRLAPEADLSRLHPDDDIRETLDIDSFDFLNLLVGLHDRLGVDIPESDYNRVRSLKALTEYLATRVRTAK